MLFLLGVVRLVGIFLGFWLIRILREVFGGACAVLVLGRLAAAIFARFVGRGLVERGSLNQLNCGP